VPLQPFDQICHDVAMAEMRACVVPGPSTSGPGGRHILREFYCTEPGCDCRRVMVQFVQDFKPSRVAASINYGWETAWFYTAWVRDRKVGREMAGATLEPFAEQGPHAEEFLKIFDRLIEDPQVVAAFRRHYALVKKTIAKP
jgi:hypothetical protein